MSDCMKDPAFTTGCSHAYKRLQKNGDRVFYACEHCGATKVETAEDTVPSHTKTITWMDG